MEKTFLSEGDYSRFNRPNLYDEPFSKVDLLGISNNIYDLIEKKFGDNIINKNEIRDLFEKKIEAIKIKNYSYIHFLKVVYFYYNLYYKINGDANSKFIEINKLRRLNEFDYRMKFLNFDIIKEREKNKLYKESNEKNSEPKSLEEKVIELNSSSSSGINFSENNINKINLILKSF